MSEISPARRGSAPGGQAIAPQPHGVWPAQLLLPQTGQRAGAGTVAKVTRLQGKRLNRIGPGQGLRLSDRTGWWGRLPRRARGPCKGASDASGFAGMSVGRAQTKHAAGQVAAAAWCDLRRGRKVYSASFFGSSFLAAVFLAGLGFSSAAGSAPASTGAVSTHSRMAIGALSLLRGPSLTIRV